MRFLFSDEIMSDFDVRNSLLFGNSLSPEKYQSRESKNSSVVKRDENDPLYRWRQEKRKSAIKPVSPRNCDVPDSVDSIEHLAKMLQQAGVLNGPEKLIDKEKPKNEPETLCKKVFFTHESTQTDKLQVLEQKNVALQFPNRKVEFKNQSNQIEVKTKNSYCQYEVSDAASELTEISEASGSWTEKEETAVQTDAINFFSTPCGLKNKLEETYVPEKMQNDPIIKYLKEKEKKLLTSLSEIDLFVKELDLFLDE